MRKQLPGMLSIDKKFVPAPMDYNDEMYQNGIFQFNITKMIDYIRDHADEINPISIEVRVFRTSLAILNESHIETTDISIPIILAEISPGRYNVIDGNHRLEKAYRMGVDNFKAYKLKPELHTQFLTSTDSYHAYVEYWNSKIKAGHLRDE